MAEGNAASRYVKLRKEQAPVEDITPGELNQPIDVPQLNVRKCHECMQVLPESYEPPSDENWTTGIFGCVEDPESSKAVDAGMLEYDNPVVVDDDEKSGMIKDLLKLSPLIEKYYLAKEKREKGQKKNMWCDWKRND